MNLLSSSFLVPVLRVLALLPLPILPASAQVDYSSVTNTGNVLVNNLTGEYGGRFINTTGTQVTITHLARWVAPGNNQTHTLRIYENFGALLGEVTVDCNGAPPNQFLYGELAAPVVIPIGGIVYILSTEVAGGDALYNGFGGLVTKTADIGTMETGFFNTVAASLDSGGGIGLSWGPVSFRYSSPVPTWTKSGIFYQTDGSTYQVSSAIADASPGDVIRIPAGTHTWGEGGTRLNINKPVAIIGAGMGATTITKGERKELLDAARAEQVERLYQESADGIANLSPTQVCGLLNVSPQTLAKLKIPRVVGLPGKIYWYRLRDIIAWQEDNTER